MDGDEAKRYIERRKDIEMLIAETVSYREGRVKRWVRIHFGANAQWMTARRRVYGSIALACVMYISLGLSATLDGEARYSMASIAALGLLVLGGHVLLSCCAWVWQHDKGRADKWIQYQRECVERLQENKLIRQRIASTTDVAERSALEDQYYLATALSCASTGQLDQAVVSELTDS